MGPIAMSHSTPTRKTWAAAAAAALVLSIGPALAADREDGGREAAAPRVSVVATGPGAYRVEASFLVSTTAPVAWDVLTDYDNLPAYVSSMRKSAALRDSGRTLVTQEAVGKAGPFARTLHVVLEVSEEEPRRIAFRDVGGSSFVTYLGAWAIEPDPAGVRVRYVLDARPRSSPPLFGRSIVASNARGLLDELRREMLRRGAWVEAETAVK